MANPHQAIVGEQVYIDSEEVGGPWTVILPAGAENGQTFSVRNTSNGYTPITFDPAGQTIELPRNPQQVPPVTRDFTTPFPAYMPGALYTLEYNAGRNAWWINNIVSPTPSMLQVSGAGLGPLTLDATYQTKILDVAAIYQNHIVYPSPAGNSWQFVMPGTVLVQISGSFNATASQQGRSTNVQLLSSLGILGDYKIGTGRNTEVSQFAFAFLANISPALINAEMRAEVGGGDAYADVVWNNFSVTITTPWVRVAQ